MTGWERMVDTVFNIVVGHDVDCVVEVEEE
jgi:hypothetical protein